MATWKFPGTLWFVLTINVIPKAKYLPVLQKLFTTKSSNYQYLKECLNFELEIANKFFNFFGPFSPLSQFQDELETFSIIWK